MAEIVVELAWRLEDSIDDEGEPRGVANTLEWVAGVFNHLAGDERQRLTGVIARIAAETDPGPQREFLESFPFAFCLTEDERRQQPTFRFT